MQNIRSTLKQEFTLSNICFTYSKPEAFFLPQWRWPHSIFVLYRLALALYTLAGFANHYAVMISLEIPHNPMVYLTSWSYLLLALHCNVAAIVTTYSYYVIYKITRQNTCNKTVLKSISPLTTQRTPENGHIADAMNNCVNYSENDALPARNNESEYQNQDEENFMKTSRSSEPIAVQHICIDAHHSMETGKGTTFGCSLPGAHQSNMVWRVDVTGAKTMCVKNLDKVCWFMKLTWLLFDIASLAAIMVSCMYFITIFPQNHSHGESVTFQDLNTHAFNSLIVIFELVITAYPIRLLHVLYPFLFGIMYIIFNVIYWAQDQVKNVLYPDVVDWNFPEKTVLLLTFLLFVLIPVQQCLHFLVYKLRLYIYFRIYKQHYNS
ncbi:uncharacterized protein LOC106873558 [Octopus bimaculoides]|uniref:uncharacterized protein LOC106873558 n=1 Tax=Octopus bimaculoides TaxID=37653 RepID=UPI0022E4A723|nr:uncharacterized protein LOC106873558 [Octopus bimaculoides]